MEYKYIWHKIDEGTFSHPFDKSLTHADKTDEEFEAYCKELLEKSDKLYGEFNPWRLIKYVSLGKDFEFSEHMKLR